MKSFLKDVVGKLDNKDKKKADKINVQENDNNVQERNQFEKEVMQTLSIIILRLNRLDEIPEIRQELSYLRDKVQGVNVTSKKVLKAKEKIYNTFKKGIEPKFDSETGKEYWGVGRTKFFSLKKQVSQEFE